MCLACEMDALWFAEMERAVRASSPLPAGKRSPPPYPPPLAGEGREGAGEGLSDHGEAESPSPDALRASTSPRRGEVKSAGGPPAVPASAFLCEETRSQ